MQTRRWRGPHDDGAPAGRDRSLTAGKPAAAAQAKKFAGRNGNPRYAELYRHYPTVDYLRRRARSRGPYFAFEYADGGSGQDDSGIRRNWAALDAVEIVPRYGVMPSLPACDVELFGRRYAAPIGIAPMGGPSIVWPGADEILARAAQRANIPYTLSTAGGATIERIAEVAPDVFWFQLYRFDSQGHAIEHDLVDRAEKVGCKVLVLTLDVPVATTRARGVVVGLGGAFRPNLRMLYAMARTPGWARALIRNGQPRFVNLRPYVGENAGLNDVIAFAQREMGGAFTWDEVAHYRDRWKGKLVVKGVMHPDDAEKAVALGVEGIMVSNHGGRQMELLPATIDVLPAIVAKAGTRATVMMDSGIRSGADVARACALGACAAFAGKAFLWGLGALGEDGAGHVIDLLVEETQSAFGQIGAHTPAESRNAVIRHPGAYRL